MTKINLVLAVRLRFSDRYHFARIIPGIIKTAAILITVVCLHHNNGQPAETITLSISNSPLNKIFKEIESQTGYGFAYRWDVLKKASPINLRVNHTPLKEVLDLCMADQPLSYRIVDRVIIISQKLKEE